MKSIIWLALALIATLCCLDTAQAQSASITAAPTRLNFCVASASSAAPPPQTITVSATGSQVGFTDNGFPSWIKPSPSPGNTLTANVITVQIDPSGYSGGGGPFNGVVQIVSQSNGYEFDVPVTVTIDPNCTTSSVITVTPTSLTYNSVVLGATAMQTQTLSVTGPAVQVSVDPGNGPAGWLTAAQPTGTTTQSIAVTANPSVITAAGNYTGTITISQVGNASNKVQVSASLAVTSSSGYSYTPNPAVFNIPSVGTTPSTFQINLSGPNVPVTIFQSQGNGPVGWLNPITPNGNQSSLPATLTMSVNSTVLNTGGTYNTTITVTQQGTQNVLLSIPVTITVGAANGYSLNPTSLTFQIAPGAASVTPQTVTLSGPSGVSVNASAVINNGPSLWLGVSPTGGGTNQTYTISVNPANFAAGQTYTGTIVFTQANTQVASLPVTVNVGVTNTLNAAPGQLNFIYQTGSNPPSNQTNQQITITSPANTSISYTTGASYTSCGSNWLVVSPSSGVSLGTVPQTVNVALYPPALLPSTLPSTCSATVTISAPGANPPTINIPVSVLVANSPLMYYAPQSLSFNYTPGGTLPGSQTVNLASTSTALNYTYTIVPGTAQAPVFITVSPSGSTTASTPGTLTVALDPNALTNLAGGVYTDNIVVSSNSVANPNVVIPVTLTVSNASNFVSNPSSLTFNYQIGQGQQSPSSTITLSSTGAPLQFNATATTTSCGNFILLNPASGTTSPSAGVNGTQIQVVTSGIASLTTPVVCNGSINVTSTSGANLTVPVKVNVVNTPVLNLGTSAITQSAAVGSTTQMKVQVSVTATDNASHLSYSATAATNPAGQTWLTVTPQVGQVTPANVTVTLDPTNLPAGTYTGSITITDLTPNSPVPTQTIPVTFIVAAPVSVDHTSLTFSVNQGGPAPANQTLTVSGVPPGVTIGATATTSTCGTGWLTSTVSANTVTVAITPTGLQQSASPCTGQISIVVPGAPNSPLIVPVTVNVGAPLALSLSATTANFTYTVGSSTTPAAQNVNLSATGGAAVPFTVSAATQSGGNWLTVTPTSGNTGSTPVVLMIGLNSTVVSTLGPGSYQGTVTVASTSIPNGSVTINVTLTVSAPPVAAIVSIVNAATQLPGPVAPGELVTLYGTNLGPTTGVTFTPTANGTVPTTLGGAQVFFDNTPAPIIYAGANQINAIVPYEVAGRLQTNITVSRNNTTSMAIIQMVASTSPGIFTQDASGRGAGSILNQDYSLNGPAHPAPKGSVIAIYATGEGTLNPPVATGSITGSNAPFPKPNAAVTAYFLVQQANGSTVQVPAGIEYAGEAPTLVAGVLQVNIDVPSSVPSGAQTVVIMVGSNSSPSTVTAYIQ